MRSPSPNHISRKTIMEIEQHYPYVVTLKNELRAGLSTISRDRMRESIFSVLKKTESYMSSEVSKLRNKPNRATKYAAYMRRLISQLKLSLSWIVEKDEVTAYPTLGLIITHYVNILLSSSVKERLAPKLTACQAYGFIKMIFDTDLQYVLDVMICSNVADDAAEVYSIGYHMLSEVLRDQFFFTQDSPSFAKFCAIAVLLKDSHAGEALVRETLKSVTVFPDDLHEHLMSNYMFPNDKHFGIRVVIDNIKPRRVAMVIRKERLIVVSNSSTRGEGEDDQENEDGQQTSARVAQEPSTSSNCFYFDVRGNYTQNEENGEEVSSTFQSDALDSEGEEETQSPEDGPSHSEHESGNEAEVEVHSENESERGSIKSINYDELRDDDEEEVEDLESGTGTVDPGTEVPFDEMYERRELQSSLGGIDAAGTSQNIGYTPVSDDEDKEYYSDYEAESNEVDRFYDDQGSKSESEYKADSDSDCGKSDVTTQNVVKRKAESETLKNVNPKSRTKTGDESDSDLEVLVVVKNDPVKNSVEAEEEEDERDLAEPESGEDEVPSYTENDYVYNRDEDSADEQELANKNEKETGADGTQNPLHVELCNQEESQDDDQKEPESDMESCSSVRRSSRLAEKVPEKRRNTVLSESPRKEYSAFKSTPSQNELLSVVSDGERLEQFSDPAETVKPVVEQSTKSFADARSSEDQVVSDQSSVQTTSGRSKPILRAAKLVLERSENQPTPAARVCRSSSVSKTQKPTTVRKLRASVRRSNRLTTVPEDQQMGSPVKSSLTKVAETIKKSRKPDQCDDPNPGTEDVQSPKRSCATAAKAKNVQTKYEPEGKRGRPVRGTTTKVNITKRESTTEVADREQDSTSKRRKRGQSTPTTSSPMNKNRKTVKIPERADSTVTSVVKPTRGPSTRRTTRGGK